MVALGTEHHTIAKLLMEYPHPFTKGCSGHGGFNRDTAAEYSLNLALEQGRAGCAARVGPAIEMLDGIAGYLAQKARRNVGLVLVVNAPVGCVADGKVKIYPYLRDASVEILTTFLPPYAAYMIAESAGMSGVLAVVSAGLYVGWHAPRLFNARMRIPAEAVWKMVVYFLNALAFLLIGLQLPALVMRLDILSNPVILLLALAVCIVSVLVRFAWVYTMGVGLRILLNKVRTKQEVLPSWQNVFVVGWTGMRGVVTLALALALPLTLPDGSPFPFRDLIIFLSISIIIFTLVLQGISLPWLIRKLTLTFDPKRMEEEWHARVQAARNAITRLDELKEDKTVHMPALMRIREHYTERLQSLGDGPNTPLHPDHAPGLMSHPLLQAENRLWAEVLKKERETLIHMRGNYVIGDDVLHDILREMDLLAARFHHEEEASSIHEKAAQANECRQIWCYKSWLRKLLFKSPELPA